MFKRDKDKPDEAKPADAAPDQAPPLKPFSRRGSHTPRQPAQPSPDAARRLAQSIPSRRLESSRLDSPDARRLVVGREISLSGEITSCDRLVVEGRVEATLVGAGVLEVAQGGFFRGRAEVKEADISGVFDGDLTATERLLIRGGGKVSGKVRYGRVVIESGGEIGGDMQALPADSPRLP
jgi:cytoskeletal protein CcmA (bactofilin family)